MNNQDWEVLLVLFRAWHQQVISVSTEAELIALLTRHDFTDAAGSLRRLTEAGYLTTTLSSVRLTSSGIAEGNRLDKERKS